MGAEHRGRRTGEGEGEGWGDECMGREGEDGGEGRTRWQWEEGRWKGVRRGVREGRGKGDGLKGERRGGRGKGNGQKGERRGGRAHV